MRPLLAAALIACGSGSDKTPTGDSAGTSDTGGTTGVTGTPGATTDQRTATLTGTVRDCGGAGLDDVNIRFCDYQNCRYQTTEGGDGSFLFDNTLIGWNSFEAVSPAGQHLGTAYVPLEFADGQTRDLTVTLCPLDAATPMPGAATEVSLGLGLLVTLSGGAIEPPLFVDPATEVSGLWVDPANHVPTDGITGTVAAQWFVEPFNHTAVGADLPLRFDGAAVGLAAAAYRGYVGSYDDFAWLDLGTFSDGDADGYYTSDTGAGLPVLSTVMLVEE